MPRPVKKVKIDMTKPALTYDEGCQVLSVSRNTMAKIIESGQLYAIKVVEGRRWIIPTWAIRKFLGEPGIEIK